MNVSKTDLKEYVEANYCLSLLEMMEKSMKETLESVNSKTLRGKELRKKIHENNEMIGSIAYNLMCGAELIETKLNEANF